MIIVGVKKILEENSRTLKGSKDMITKARKAPGEGIKSASSPFTQKKKELYAAFKNTEESFRPLKARQHQAKMAIDVAKKKADAAKKILEVKELAHRQGKSKTNKAISDAKATAEKAKKDVKDKERDFQKSGELVKQLIAKIESQAGVRK